MGDRLLLAARKSRKASDDASGGMERQDHKAMQWAERAGHTVISSTADTVSSQTAPWQRRSLKPWMTDARKLGLYDAILVSDTDRLSRGTDEDFHWIETWCYANNKRIIVADGPQFPPRADGMGESDRYQWIAQKRAARTYWEAVRDKHAGGRELCREHGGFVGKPVFGYQTAGVKYAKTLVPHPVNAALAVEMFTRIAGAAGQSPQTAATVAAWLTAALGRPVRVKFVLDCVRNATYLGERDGCEFAPLVSRELWDAANAAVAARSFTRQAPASVHGYSGVIHCANCGAVLYRHQSSRDGQPVGAPKYRCGTGRRGVQEARCGMPGLPFDVVNERVGAVMSTLAIAEQVQRSAGGDAGKASELAAIDRQMKSAMGRHDMPEVARLAAAYAERDARPSEPVRVWWQPTGRSLGQLWADGNLERRRELLRAGIGAHEYVMVINADCSAELADATAEFADVRAWDDDAHGEFSAA